MTFTTAKQKFNKLYKTKDILSKSFVKSAGKDISNI